MRSSECGGKWDWHTEVGSPLEYMQYVVRLEPEWGPLLGSEATPCLFGHGVLWLGKRKALV